MAGSKCSTLAMTTSSNAFMSRLATSIDPEPATTDDAPVGAGAATTTPAGAVVGDATGAGAAIAGVSCAAPFVFLVRDPGGRVSLRLSKSLGGRLGA